VYYLDYRDPLGNRKRLSTGTGDLAAAERIAHDLIAGRDRRSDVWTVRRALEQTLKMVWQHQKDARKSVSLVRLICEDLGHIPLHEVTYQTLEDYVSKLREEELSGASINRRLAKLSKAMNEAAKRGVIPACPPIPRQREGQGRLRWLSEAEEQRLLEAVSVALASETDRETMRNVIAFLVDTGARQGEMLRLEERDIGDGQVSFVETKNGKSRAVPTTTRAAKAARYIVRLSSVGLMWDWSALSKKFRRVADAAGLPGVTCHTLRHTCASRLVQRGVSLYRVKDWLGHSSITVTERYAHLKPDHLSGLQSVLEGGNGFGHGTNGHSATTVTPFRRVSH
jgi:integrase